VRGAVKNQKIRRKQKRKKEERDVLLRICDLTFPFVVSFLSLEFLAVREKQLWIEWAEEPWKGSTFHLAITDCSQSCSSAFRFRFPD
jgi:hypothetical protein